MATFSDLPLELVRCIIGFALTPPFDGFRRILNLRLINRLFDGEVMSSIGKLELPKHESVHCRTVPWHHPNDGTAVSIESGVLFLARYALDRPHNQMEWSMNISALLNCLVDALVEMRDQPMNDPACRLQILTILCRNLLTQSGRRRGFHLFIMGTNIDTSIGGRPWISDVLWPPMGKLTCTPFADLLVHARIVLGPPWSDGVNGTTEYSGVDYFASNMNAAISNGNISLFRDIFKHQAQYFSHIRIMETRYLEAAVCSGSLDVVRIVLDLPECPSHPLSGPLYDGAIAQAIRGRVPDITVTRRLPRRRRRRGGVRARDGPVSRLQPLGVDCARTFLEIASSDGHEEVVRLLLGAGVDPRGFADLNTGHHPTHRGADGHPVFSTGAMFAAAVNGHVGVANLLLRADGFRLSETEWQLVARGVVECGQAAMLEWMLANQVLGPKGWCSKKFDLLGEACVWGTTAILRVLEARGMLLNRAVWAAGLAKEAPVSRSSEAGPEPGTSFPNDRDCSLLRFGSQPPCLRFDSPLLAAMSWSRPDVVEFLLARGWAPIQHVSNNTSIGRLWDAGQFPRRAVRCMVDSKYWAWEEVSPNTHLLPERGNDWRLSISDRVLGLGSSLWSRLAALTV
ncbi:hypothetical protein PG995_013870 [Apiospora arundinis]